MAAVAVENYALQSSTHAFSAIWQLTRVIKQAGWSKLASSDGSAKEVSATQSADKWGGNATPTADTYSAGFDAVSMWIVLQGPTVIMVQFTAAITLGGGTVNFIVGEAVTQATSGATGEFLGYDFDAVNGAHAVIMPRTGTFDSTHVVTGSVSGASFTATGIKTFITEIVICKNTNTTAGSIYCQCVCNETENASRFSVLASSAGCTATVPPGGAGTGNAFPTAGTWVMLGTNTGSVSHTNWLAITTGMGKAQIVAANCTPAAGVSADGTWFMAVGDTATADRLQPIAFLRCDDGEPADVNPFVSFHLTTSASGDRTASVSTSWTSAGSGFYAGIGGSPHFKGWRRRGFATNDAFAGFCPTIAHDVLTGFSFTNNMPTPERIACSYATTPPLFRERIRLIAQDNTKKMRKGHPRWMDTIQGQTTFDIMDSKTRMALNAGLAGTAGTAIMGLFDGATTPTQT